MKSAQSVFDYLRLLPSRSARDTTLLYKIWETADRDEYGRLIIPASVDPLEVVELANKGYIQNPTKSGYDKSATHVTKKGKEIIKGMILKSNKSAFDKPGQKTASLKETEPKQDNWLTKIVQAQTEPVSREILADLGYISRYAEHIRQELVDGKPISPAMMGYMQQMQHLTEKVNRWAQSQGGDQTHL